MPFDHEWTRAPDISAMLRDAFAYTFLQSHAPFLDDFTIRQIDIRKDLARIGIDMTWVLGGVEVYSPDHKPGFFFDEADLERMEAENPRLTIRRVAEAADLICYQRPQEVAQAIIDAVEAG